MHDPVKVRQSFLLQILNYTGEICCNAPVICEAKPAFLFRASRDDLTEA